MRFYSVNPLAVLDADMVSIPVLVWALYAGIVIGVLMMYYNKSILGKAVRAILTQGAIGREAALSAEVLGFAKNPFIRHSIQKGALARYIRIVTPAKEGDAPLYYMEEEDRIRAELRYSNKGTDLYVVIVALILFLLVAFLAARYLPTLIDLAGGLLT